MTDRPPVWSDEAILDVLHRMEHQGQSASEVARAYGTTRNAILGMRHRVLGPQDSRRPTAGDGTMPPDWWRRGCDTWQPVGAVAARLVAQAARGRGGE